MKKLLAIVACFMASVLFFSTARAGEWRVAPIRVDLTEKERTAAVTIINEKPEKTVLQASLAEWTQDNSGTDHYTEAHELIFSPKMLTFDTDGEKMIRIGMKSSPGEREKAYRLYIQEIPSPEKRSRGANVVIALRFGLPVFVKPKQGSAKVTTKETYISGGIFHLLLNNAGNVHSLIRNVKVEGKNQTGKTVFEKDLNGWYLLAGATRDYSAAIPKAVCSDIASLHFSVDSEEGELDGKLDITSSLCAL